KARLDRVGGSFALVCETGIEAREALKQRRALFHAACRWKRAVREEKPVRPLIARLQSGCDSVILSEQASQFAIIGAVARRIPNLPAQERKYRIDLTINFARRCDRCCRWIIELSQIGGQRVFP